MPSSTFRRVLQAIRGQSPDLVTAASSEAPIAQNPGLTQAYTQPVNPAIQQSQTPNPFMFNQGLENQAAFQGSNIPMNPVIQSILKRFGLMNMLRNRSNQQMTVG